MGRGMGCRRGLVAAWFCWLAAGAGVSWYLCVWVSMLVCVCGGGGGGHALQKYPRNDAVLGPSTWFGVPQIRACTCSLARVFRIYSAHAPPPSSPENRI
jgi:hypothetical protein